MQFAMKYNFKVHCKATTIVKAFCLATLVNREALQLGEQFEWITSCRQTLMASMKRPRITLIGGTGKQRFEQQEKNEAEQHSSEIACGSHRLQALLGTELLHRGHWLCMWLMSISVWCAYAAGEPTDQLCAWIEKYIPKLDAASKFCHVFWEGV